MTKDLTFIIPCLMGLEGIVAEELRRLKMEGVQAENGRVTCKGSMADIPRLNLNLRCGARVLLELGSFLAEDFELLFQGTTGLPWEVFIPRDGAFPVKGYTLNSKLHSVPACQAVVNKAIAKRLGGVYGMERLPETGRKYQVQFSIMKDVASLCLDTTGQALHKRGYRAVGVEAPLRETLAAALVILSGYKGRDAFCDPFCGSGTIAIEAALIAQNRAPGLNRSFAAQRWECLDSGLWVQAAEEAMDQEFRGKRYEIWGGDLDPHAVEIARSNAAKAEVEEMIRFEVADATRFHWGGECGRVVTNPPYGERLLEKQEAGALYAAFGRACAKLPGTWRVHVLSSHTEFERAFGRQADKKRKLYNGMLKCNLFTYDRAVAKQKALSRKQDLRHRQESKKKRKN